jgi:hypothetical protein
MMKVCLQVVISEGQNVTWVIFIMNRHDFGQIKAVKLHLYLQGILFDRIRLYFPLKSDCLFNNGPVAKMKYSKRTGLW